MVRIHVHNPRFGFDLRVRHASGELGTKHQWLPGTVCTCFSMKMPHINILQFFITTAKCDFLDGKHVVFGKVIDGMLTLRKIENVPTGPNNRPKLAVKIVGRCCFMTSCGLSEQISIIYWQSVARCSSLKLTQFSAQTDRGKILGSSHSISLDHGEVRTAAVWIFDYGLCTRHVLVSSDIQSDST